MIDKIKSKLADVEFREKIFNIIIFVTAFKYQFSSSIIVSNNRTAKFKNFISIKYFLLQIILYIPYKIYDIYFSLFFVRKLKKSKRKIDGKIKKIGIYSPWFDKFAGGGEQVAAHLAQFFEIKYPESEIEIICDDWYGHEIIKTADIADINEKYGTTLSRTKVNFYKHHFFSLIPLRYEKNLFKLSSKYDVYVNCFMNSMSAYAAINLHYVHFPFKKRDCKSKIQFNNYKKAYDFFITNSQFTQEWAKKYLNLSNTKVIYPAVNIPELNEFPTKQNIILTVGRFDEVKCFEIMIDTFLQNEHLFPDYELHIAGAYKQSREPYFNALKKRAKSEKIKFITNLTYLELQDKYKNSKIYWQSMGFGFDVNKFPSKYEHFGITIVEAISCGCVPFVVEHGGPAEIVKNGNCGYIWRTKEELAAKTISLINDPKKLEELQKRCIFEAKNYSVESFRNEMSILMDNLIQSTL